MPNPPSADFVTSSLSGALAAGATTATIGTGLNLSATDGLLQIDADSTAGVGNTGGPETILYTSYNSTTGALTGITRGQYGTTDVAHSNAATVQAGMSVGYLNNLGDGWSQANETWTYAAADSPSFTLTITGDKTSKYSVGMRVKLTQTTTKYFIITKVSYSNPSTTLTLYGGTDYTLTNATINSPYYSANKAPQGFPLDPTKWTVQLRDTTSRTQSSPTAGTYYNPGSLSIVVPIGAWDVTAHLPLFAQRSSGATDIDFYSALSTSNNSVSDDDLKIRNYFQFSGATGERNIVYKNFHKKFLVLTSKTTYYPIAMITVNAASLGYTNDQFPTVVNATCAYL